MDPDGRVGRAVQKVSSTKGFMRVAPHVLPPIDKFLNRTTKGRFMLAQSMTPSLILTTIGAKSGLARETPMSCFADSDAFIVVGSNYGRERHPAWTHNLLAHPDATISYKGRRIDVRARLLRGEEREIAWKKVTGIFSNYNVYQERVSREIRLFRLEPVGS